MTFCVLMLKRLLRKPGWAAVLLLMLLLPPALSLIARTDSGLVTVAVAFEDREIELPESAVLRYIPCESADGALALVRGGRADAAWVFGDMAEELAFYAQHGWSEGAVTVYEREENVFLRLSREALYGAVFPELSRELYRAVMAEEFGETEESVLRQYYDSAVVETKLVEFERLGGATPEGENYLTAPLRGLLAAVVLIGALASAVYACRDEREDIFLWLPPLRRRLRPLLSHFLAALPLGMAALLSLLLAGLTMGFCRELGLMLGYCAACALFAELLRLLCRREETLGAAIPLVVIATLALCPIFVDLNILRPLRWALPTYWYCVLALA